MSAITLLGFHSTWWSEFLRQGRNHKDTLQCVKQAAEGSATLDTCLVKK